MTRLTMKNIKPIDIMRYYVTYCNIEKDIIAGIKSKNKELREESFKKYVNNHMKIGRNFKEANKSWAMILGATENYFMNGNFDIIELSNIYYTNGLLNNRIKNASVAASKLLWLFAPEIIIMDNINMKKLKAKDYNDYTIKWTEEFDKNEHLIKEIIVKCFKNIDSIMDNKWFRMRVFDQHLLMS